MARSRSHDVFLYATQYGYSVGSTLIERVLRFSGSRRTMMGKRLLSSGCSLSRTTTPALWVSVLVVGKEAYARDAEDEQLTFLWRLVDISDSATTTTSPRPGDASPTTTWTGCIFFACLSMTQYRTTTYTGWRHARQQPDFLLLFGTCGDSLSGTTTGHGAAEWIKTIVLSSPFSSTSNRKTALKLGTTDLRGLRNTLVQKKIEIYLRQESRFWSVHACLKARGWCQTLWLGYGWNSHTISQKSTSLNRRQYS